MQRMTLEMPVVGGCSATACVYNAEGDCHAKAITIGDGMHPGCDTFMHASEHVADNSHISGVGACKVNGCSYNQDYECTAHSIEVGRSGDSVQCLTFRS